MNKTIVTIIVLIVVFLIINSIVQNREPVPMQVPNGIQEKTVVAPYVEDPWCLEHECKG